MLAAMRTQYLGFGPSRFRSPDSARRLRLVGHFQFLRQTRRRFGRQAARLTPSQDAGYVLTLVQSLAAGLERRAIIRRTQVAKEEKRKLGRHVTGKATLPRGVTFVLQTGVWSYVEPYANQIKQAFTLLLRGRSIRSIARELGTWTPRGLRLALSNPVWIGVRRYDQRRGEKYPSKDGKQCGRKKIARAEPLEVRIALEPLITEEVFQRAQEILAAARTGWRSSRSEVSRFEGSGIFFCAICGERIYSRSDHRQGKDGYYICKSRYNGGQGCGARHMRRDRADHTLAAAVSHVLTSPHAIQELMASFNQRV